MTFFCSSLDFRPENWTSADELNSFFFCFSLDFERKTDCFKLRPSPLICSIQNIANDNLNIVELEDLIFDVLEALLFGIIQRSY